ncbi:alpha-mannosidase [Sciscionella sediminilitoris]|uniref:alpha-mannosidase n=1 Tax=Sciscionella sediminilitoris TaxID=1445613 RepID=UPI0004DF3625|nr:glycoside hydrolase family 38 C-terminal domain-containing protein [Sciscionella sp. SE31]
MHDDRKLTEDRITRALRERIRPAVYGAACPVELEVWHVDGEPVPVGDALGAQYGPFAVGERWGPPWGTSWFHVRGRVPGEWAGRRVELVLDLGFDADRPGFQCEGLVYLPDGTPVKGLNPRNAWIPVGDPVSGGEQVEFYVEAAANPLILDDGDLSFAPTPLGDPATAGTEPLYRIARAELAVFEEPVWELVADIEVLDGLMRTCPEADPRRWELLRALASALDVLDLGDIAGTARAARDRLAPALSGPARSSAHRISAIGHAHIDSAWLWPLRETVRKVARTASNVTALMDTDPGFVFAMSQAQQLAWIEEHHPKVFAKVAEKIAAGQFVPVGGMWVEADTNMPGSEAMARQFVHGKRYFLDRFGVETEEVWLPDSFGYSAALPQLVTASASKWFLTQKISWSQTNKFPHHTFLWEGIDGTRVLTHFPPVDTYNSELIGRELAHASANYQEKGAATRSLVPFGHGDGGGGPTREMLARAARTADLDGSPKVAIEAPRAFFTHAEQDYPAPPVWVGELYLEFHRGTYTSQAKTKQGNRRSEHLLREAELWSATAAVHSGFEYPYERLDRIWKTVLLNQFHDILPGSSIAWVHRDAEHAYARAAEELEEIIGSAQHALAGTGSRRLVFNAAPHARDGIAAGGADTAENGPEAVTVREHEGGFRLANGALTVTVDAEGLISSVLDGESGREVVPQGTRAALLQLHQDLPNRWDAWDIDEFYRNSVTDLTAVDELVATADGVRITRSFGSSALTQWLRLRGRVLEVETEVDWHESEKMLKLAFPVDVHADRCACEVQFGHTYRPTHDNTSWDAAKFEICAHRWVHVAEPDFGVALVNDATYGHDVSRTATPAGIANVLRASLLRAPRFPDPETDHGRHRFRHALVVGAGIGDAVREGYRINLPAREIEGANPVHPLVTVDNPDVVVESVKLAEDRSGDVVLRLYESGGTRAEATVRASFGVERVAATDLLERDWAEPEEYAHPEGGFTIALRPFQLRTIRFTRGATPAPGS